MHSARLGTVGGGLDGLEEGISFPMGVPLHPELVEARASFGGALGRGERFSVRRGSPGNGASSVVYDFPGTRSESGGVSSFHSDHLEDY